jgi:electron transport complex protein RnfG
MKSLEMAPDIVSAGVLLAFTALLGTALMTGINWHSQPYIEKNEREVLLNTLNAVLPANSYDNDILNDTIEFQDSALLGSRLPIKIYRARKHGKPVAAVLNVIAPDGYSGPIHLLVGINYDGLMNGVRVVKHKETPGLGDAIEERRSDWIRSFDNRSLDNPASAAWKVKRDGGEFDQLTGATITPRAVVKAVHKALLFYQAQRESIFAQTDKEK